MRKTREELNKEREELYNNSSRYKINSIRNEMVLKIKNELKKKIGVYYEDQISGIQHIWDPYQNYCVYLRNNEKYDTIKQYLKEIGAKKFRKVNKGNTICFYMDDGLPIGKM